MVNNELSGPYLATFLAEYLNTKKTFIHIDFIFVPETIGMLAYLSKRLTIIKKILKLGIILRALGIRDLFL